jgi:hypothetical protein
MGNLCHFIKIKQLTHNSYSLVVPVTMKGARVAESRQLATGWTSEKSAHSQEMFIVSRTSRLTRVPTQPPMHCVPGAFPQGYSCWYQKVTILLHPVRALSI